jgi:hypothetical protein
MRPIPIRQNVRTKHIRDRNVQDDFFRHRELLAPRPRLAAGSHDEKGRGERRHG